MVELAGPSERSEFAAVVVRTDFTDEAAWHRVTTELRKSALDDADPAASYVVLDAPGADPSSDAGLDALLAEVAARGESWEEAAVLFVADGTALRAEPPALLAVTTFTRDDLDEGEYAELVEFGRAFRTVPDGVHAIHANLELGNMGFEEYAASAHEAPDGMFHDFLDS
ncbi:DUF6924 domain-containing protein [Streptomyces rubiginosohelvolus]|uniref:DUF6924 domain-containing protein n=1 Tax=Streptomyces rubiginosohelvolus TaxID=67362 RepID=UPI0033AC5F54